MVISCVLFYRASYHNESPSPTSSKTVPFSFSIERARDFSNLLAPKPLPSILSNCTLSGDVFPSPSEFPVQNHLLDPIYLPVLQLLSIAVRIPCPGCCSIVDRGLISCLVLRIFRGNGGAAALGSRDGGFRRVL